MVRINCPLYRYADAAIKAGHNFSKKQFGSTFQAVRYVRSVFRQAIEYDCSMSDSGESNAAHLTQRLLDKANLGDNESREQLFRHSCDRLERLARKMLRDFPIVRRWEQTTDVFQNAAIRLMRAFEDVKPESTRHFYALAATQIRRELIDLARHYGGANAEAHSFESQNQQATDGDRSVFEPAELTHAPDRLASWTELHGHIAELPNEDREVCEMLWYQGLTQGEAAELLEMPLRTLKRRWQKVRITLHDKMNGQLP